VICVAVGVGTFKRDRDRQLAGDLVTRSPSSVTRSDWQSRAIVLSTVSYMTIFVSLAFAVRVTLNNVYDSELDPWTTNFIRCSSYFSNIWSVSEPQWPSDQVPILRYIQLYSIVYRFRRGVAVIRGALAQTVPEHPKKENVFAISTVAGDAFLFQASTTNFNVHFYYNPFHCMKWSVK